MFYSYFPKIERLMEMVKTYHCLKFAVDTTELKKKIDNLRFEICQEALQRMSYYKQIPVAQLAANQTQPVFFSSDDIKSVMKRMLFYLDMDVTIALTHQGLRQNVFTREAVAWQQIGADVQNVSALNGQNIPFDLPTEIYFNENESLSYQITNQSSGEGFIFPQGANLIDNSVNLAQVKQEIQENETPQNQLVPIIYQFTGATDTYAVNPNGEPILFSEKNDRSVILTHVSVTGLDCRISLADTGKNQEFCDLVEMRGVAGEFNSQYAVYYPLPYPHLLMQKDRLRARILNGSDITGTDQDEDVFNYLTFYGFTI